MTSSDCFDENDVNRLCLDETDDNRHCVCTRNYDINRLSLCTRMTLSVLEENDNNRQSV